MAEQGYFTATNIPIDGQPADASTVNTSLLGLINEFNKQVPLTKISADQAWQTWTPVFTGFSTAPVMTARYCKMGRLCLFNFMNITAGTSNANSFSFTLPFATAQTTELPCGRSVDNTTYVYNTYCQLNAGSNIAVMYITDEAGAWTTSGNKFTSMVGFYETLS